MGVSNRIVNRFRKGVNEPTDSADKKPTAVKPVLSIGSLCMLSAVTVLFGYLCQSPAAFSNRFFFGIGGAYGVATGWLWVCSLVEQRLLRTVLKLVVVCLCSFWIFRMSQDTGEPWFRYATQLGGMAITQGVLFHLLRIPAWRLRRGVDRFNAEGLDRKQLQFDILDVMLVTTAYSVLMALAIRYRPPIDSSQYWSVVFGLWMFFPFLAAITANATLSCGVRRQLAQFALVGVLGTAGSIGLAMLEVVVERENSPDAGFFLVSYAVVTLGYAASIALFGLAGRLHHFTSRFERSDTPSTGL